VKTLSNYRKIIEFVALLALAALIIWLFGRKLDWQQVKVSVQNSDWRLILIAIVIILLAYLWRVVRWQALLKPMEKAGHLGSVDNLKDARKAFHPFSEASVTLAQALRRLDKEFASVKVFRCPMTKDAFPGAPNRADWIQLKPEVRNPWFGAEMIDCGSEVKP